jgi:hypothetical protein
MLKENVRSINANSVPIAILLSGYFFAIKTNNRFSTYNRRTMKDDWIAACVVGPDPDPHQIERLTPD